METRLGINTPYNKSKLVSHKMTSQLKIAKIEIGIMKELRNDEDHMWHDIVLEFTNRQKCVSMVELIELKKDCLREMGKINRKLADNQSTQERIAMKEVKRDMLMERDTSTKTTKANKRDYKPNHHAQKKKADKVKKRGKPSVLTGV